MATWSNNSKNSSTFANTVNSGGTSILFGDLPLSYFDGYTFDDIPLGGYKAIKDYTFDEPLSLAATTWSNATKNSSTYANQSAS